MFRLRGRDLRFLLSTTEGDQFYPLQTTDHGFRCTGGRPSPSFSLVSEVTGKKFHAARRNLCKRRTSFVKKANDASRSDSSTRTISKFKYKHVGPDTSEGMNSVASFIFLLLGTSRIHYSRWLRLAGDKAGKAIGTSASSFLARPQRNYPSSPGAACTMSISHFAPVSSIPPRPPTIFGIARNLARREGQITGTIRFVKEFPAARVTTGFENKGFHPVETHVLDNTRVIEWGTHGLQSKAFSFYRTGTIPHRLGMKSDSPSQLWQELCNVVED